MRRFCGRKGSEIEHNRPSFLANEYLLPLIKDLLDVIEAMEKSGKNNDALS